MMKFLSVRALIAAIAMMAVAFVETSGQSPPSQQPASSTHMTNLHAKGTFEVTLKPLPPANPEAGEKLGRMSFSKQFAGDLAGTSTGEMLSAGTDIKGSAGYVAIERVTGTLAGRKGSFVLQHSGTMDRGNPQSTIVVVPDSGTEELAGLVGKFRIDIKEGKHFYEFEYKISK